MSARDDELDAGVGDEHDPMLRGMRGVWREMRDADEEPPARGLDALMAAARVQAAAMKPAPERAYKEEVPWWRRAFAMMVRPPVLAAATVIVLVGGAVALKSRGADEVASPTADTAKQGDPDMGGERQKKEEGRAVHADAAVVESETVVATPKVDPPAENKPAKDNWGAGGAGNGQAPPPVVTKPPGGKPQPERKLEEPRAEPQKPEPNAVKQEEAGRVPPKDPPPQQPQNGLVIANDGEADKPADKPAVKSTARRPAKQPESAQDALEVTGSGRQQSTIEQLIKQAETAASRNDCAAVKVTVERIRKLDPNVYKSRVANQPAIAKCLK